MKDPLDAYAEAKDIMQELMAADDRFRGNPWNWAKLPGMTLAHFLAHSHVIHMDRRRTWWETAGPVDQRCMLQPGRQEPDYSYIGQPAPNRRRRIQRSGSPTRRSTTIKP